MQWRTVGFHIVQIGVDYFPRSRGVSTLSSLAVIRRMLREIMRFHVRGIEEPAERDGSA